ncbi:MAG: hypothetical protein Q6365_022000 [Candidatus Sigynarchaeota archaeon]
MITRHLSKPGIPREHCRQQTREDVIRSDCCSRCWSRPKIFSRQRLESRTITIARRCSYKAKKWEVTSSK